MLLWLVDIVVCGCFISCAEGGGRVSARRPRYLFFASPKKSTQKKGDPAGRVPLAGGEGATCDARSWGVPQNSLRSSNSAQTAAASLTTMRVSCGTRSPQALRFSARPEGIGGPTRAIASLGPICLAALRPVGSAKRVTNTRRSCEAAAVFEPDPHPCWLRREAQELGWACVPKDTHASWSSLPQLFERSSKNAASSAAPPQVRASQVAPFAHRAKGDADWGSPFLW